MSTIIQAGIIASPGICMGQALVLKNNNAVVPKYYIKDSQTKQELVRLFEAITKTKEDIEDIHKHISSVLSDDVSDIFATHMMILEDPMLNKLATEEISQKKRNAEWAINEIATIFMESMHASENEYLSERAMDISDISKRVIGNLQHHIDDPLSDINNEVILFAPDLSPSETAVMNKKYVQAFVTSQGGKTSHTAIMARALNIPSLVGVKNAHFVLKSGDTVIVDAIDGKLIINPSEIEIEDFKKKQTTFINRLKELNELAPLASQTRDKTDIYIFGNIDVPEKMDIFQQSSVQGIGLFRSELLFLGKTIPNEEEQFIAYKKIVEHFNPMPVTIRTLDVGGDKLLTNSSIRSELNPFLGCRAIRFCLNNKYLFKMQLRAILRASAYGTVKLMFPMISTPDELQLAREITEEAKDELRIKNIPFDDKIQIGIMIEVPSAAINADILAKNSDFFSVGTNDLVQYLLAVDRRNESVAHLYNPLNPAVLRTLKSIVKTSTKHNVSLSICGEMAGEAQYIMVLLGLGFRHFSMSPANMPEIKKLIRSVTIAECEKIAEEVMELTSVVDIENHVINSFLKTL